jgi:hypothetical protein
MTSKLGPAIAVAVAALFIVLALAACGGGGDSGGAQGSGAKAWQKAQLEYAKCMREHGVDFPDPVNGRRSGAALPGRADDRVRPGRPAAVLGRGPRPA